MSYDRIIRDALRLARSPRRFALGGDADPKDISPSISNPVSVFPKPQRMFPSDAPVPGGQYLGMPDKQDMTGHKSAVASIGVSPGGKPYFNASRDAVDQTGTAGKAKTKTNLFKQKAGWSWQTAPEGHEDTNTIVSVEHRGKHYYTLNAHFPKGVDFARYAESRSEPRLRPTTTGDVFLGPQAGTISVRGKEHPVYHHVVVKADGGAVGYASGGDVDQPRNLDDMGFYSSAAESARSLPQSKGTPQQMLATMKGVKPAELEWSGVQDKFAGQKSVTKDDLAQHFEQNVPQIKETVLGGKIDPEIKSKRDAIIAEYDSDINELRQRVDIMYSQGAIGSVKALRRQISNLILERDKRLEDEAPIGEIEPTKYGQYTVGNDPKNYREVLLHLPGEEKFKSSHWEPTNIVTHLRMQDRGPDNNILHLEELQSDWAQKGRDEGFDTKDMKEKREFARNEFSKHQKYLGDKYGFHPGHDLERYAKLMSIPNDEVSKYKNLYSEVSRLGGFDDHIEPAPYVTNTDHWVELGLKRALLEAARGGYDKLVWTPGEEQAKRYDLSKQISKVTYHPLDKSFNAYDKSGRNVIYENDVEPHDIKKYIGNELAEKLLEKSDYSKSFLDEYEVLRHPNSNKWGLYLYGEPSHDHGGGMLEFDSKSDAREHLNDKLQEEIDRHPPSLEGLDLKVGGEGMKSFYDKMLPSALRRVLKPHTDKIQPTSHVVKGNDGENVTLPGIEITPELRESILKRGFSYYARGGEVRQHFEVGGGAAGGDSDTSGGGFGDSGSGGDSAPDATQDSPAFSTDAPPSYSPPESDPSMLGGATGTAFSPPGSGSLGVGVGNTSGSFLGTAEQQLNTGPGIVGFIGGTPLGLVALGAEKLNEAAREQGYDVVDPGGARPGRGAEQASREQAAYEAGFPGNRAGGNDSGMIPDPLAPEPSFYGFRLSNDDEETQAGMVKPVGFAPPPPPAPMMARGGVPQNIHPVLSIPGVHIREEIHGRPIFLGEEFGKFSSGGDVPKNKNEGIIVSDNHKGKIPDVNYLVKNKNRFIYHSSPADPNDLKHGIDPMSAESGTWTSENMDSEDYGMSESEYGEYKESLPKASWYSRKPEWVKTIAARKLGKHENELMEDDIKNHGHLALVHKKDLKDYNIYWVGDDFHHTEEVTDPYGKRKKVWSTPLHSYSDIFGNLTVPGIEENEYVSTDSIEPFVQLTGDALVEFLKKTGNL